MMWLIPPILLNLLAKYKFELGWLEKNYLLQVTSKALQMYEVKILP